MTTDKLRFDNKVVIITGAGGGLGKCYALLFASRGAKVVVNDLGGGLSGSGSSNKAADIVVNEIKSNGGIAVANYDNVVTNPQGILETAIDNFGTVHILINNAGILRDSSFKNMSEQQFNQVLDVHLNSAYKLTNMCWKYFKDQKYGRIINTASPAGLYGNFGQANYSAAKLGLVGFAETLAKEGAKYNIIANSIAPLARSRMTESILPPDILEKLGAEKVAPLVVALTHDSVNISGAIFEVAAGFYAQIRWERSGGALLKPNNTLTPEAFLNKFDDVISFKDKSQIQHPIMLNDYNKLYDLSSNFKNDNNQGKTKINSLKSKVVIITGAGGGLGKSHALWFAKYGAKVVVNDFNDPNPVVEEIKKLGGEAVGSKHDVYSQAEDIVKVALDKFGTVDVLVNNAGILRDRSFLKLTEKEWDQVVKIHLSATFRLCKLVWPIFLQQKKGCIINTTSTSGIYGNFGQANYAAAKAAVLGFSRTLAIEGKKANIKVVAYAPHAETAMTKTIFGASDLNKFSPDQVSPFVVLLASDEVPDKVSGKLFEVGAGWAGETRWQRAKGAVCHSKETAPEFITENWKDIVDFSKSITVGSTQESSMAILETIGGDDEEEEEDEDEEEESSEKEDDEDEEEVDDSIYKFDHRQVILYNLSVGAKSKELKYSYENAEDFQVLPTFGVIPFMTSQKNLEFSDILDNYNPALLLHGEHYLKINQQPIPIKGSLKTISKPIAILNKSNNKNALLINSYETIDTKTNKTIFTNEGSFFVRNCHSKSGKDEIYGDRVSKFATLSFNAPKSIPPIYEVEFKTSEDQAALYRLNADFNPLHIDPNFAKAAKFGKPILHGLCFLGISAKLISDKFGFYDEIKCRFTGSVYPGETLKIVCWKDSSNTIIFQTWVVERKSLVISNAALKLINTGSSKL